MTEISKTADRVLAILIELADAGASTPQQLAARMGINRTVMQRLLTTLLARGFVTRSGGEYALDSRLLRLAAAVQPELRHAAVPPTTALSAKTGETVVLQVQDGGEIVVLHEAIQVRRVSLQVRHDVGARSPLTTSASGLAILAASRASATRRVMESQDDRAELAARLERIRAEGFALTSDQLQAGVSGLARAVLHRGAPVGSIAILVPTTRVDDLSDYRDPLERTVRRVERALG